MHRAISLGRCSMAVALATILLTSPAIGFAQLGGLPRCHCRLHRRPRSSTIVGDASAARVSVLGILGTAMTTGSPIPGLSQPRTMPWMLPRLAGGIPAALSAETLSASTISWAIRLTPKLHWGT